jgi:hypothetical protein
LLPSEIAVGTTRPAFHEGSGGARPSHSSPRPLHHVVRPGGAASSCGQRRLPVVGASPWQPTSRGGGLGHQVPPPLAVGCRRLPQRRRRWICAVVGLLMSLLADLWPLRWRLAARWRWRHVSPPLAFGGEDYSGGVSLRIGTAASMVGGGVLVPDEGDLWWLVSCARGIGLHGGGRDGAVSCNG